ncbi:TPA: ATP-binding protein [Candidatus Woesearchaeota archaeon]|nr:ATP-binding protein [Candidatus Woesearchaeota archaeon]HIG93039.1 ATP-binding protein [Candidatus Woesearchaeota archaeon]HIH12766.1 ATP-binding protein [Candidatus Woesearchaeota archaeon]
MVKYVITGGPGTGKTTLIHELQQQRYAIVPEAARQIIQEEQQKKEGILPWTNLYEFQRKVVERQLDLEEKVGSEICFVDRGIVDNLAYCRMGKIEVPQDFQKIDLKNRYVGVFLLDFLPKYEIDLQRKEDALVAPRLHDMIKFVYIELGYGPTPVPVLEPKERARYVIERIQRGDTL